MNAIQLEFNLDNMSDRDMRLQEMQKQIDALCESNSKVRRKLFSEMGEIKKELVEIRKENLDLKIRLKELEREKTEWVYQKQECLFDIQEPMRAIC